MCEGGLTSIQWGRRGVLVVAVWVSLLTAAYSDEGGTSSQEVESLRRQVKYLSESLAGARAQVDALKARLDRNEFDEVLASDVGKASEPTEPGENEYRILEVNKELGMAVISAGRCRGLRPGLQFAVLHKDKVMATVKIVDVREAIAGAVIQKVSGCEPRAQDRAVLVTESRE